MNNFIGKATLATFAGALGLSLVAMEPALAAERGSSESPVETSTLQLAQAGTIVDVASSNDDFSTLVAALEAAEFVPLLSGDGPFTVFAPTNEAFEALDNTLTSTYGIGVADLLKPENQNVLQAVLAYHVVGGAAIASGDIPQGMSEVEVLTEEDLQITRSGDAVNVNNASVTAVDVEASNGVIHVIDTVLLPPGVVAALDATLQETVTEETVTVTEETVTVTETVTESSTPASAVSAPASSATQEPIRGLW